MGNEILNENKIEYLDAAFLGTQESKGFKNAKSAIKLCLFNDMSVLNGKQIDYSKWLLISTKFDGRKKAKQLQVDDLAYILIKYAMTSFGLRNTVFSVDEKKYMDHRQNPVLSSNLTRNEAVELLAYAAFNDLYSAYVFLFTNNYVCNLVVDSLIEERYLNMLKDVLDNYDGKINNDEVDTEFKYLYYKKYQSLDSLFASLKNETKISN